MGFSTGNIEFMQYKSCFKCGEMKPISEFYKHRGMKDGHLNNGECSGTGITEKDQTDKDKPPFGGFFYKSLIQSEVIKNPETYLRKKEST